MLTGLHPTQVFKDPYNAIVLINERMHKVSKTFVYALYDLCNEFDTFPDDVREHKLHYVNNDLRYYYSKGRYLMAGCLEKGITLEFTHVKKENENENKDYNWELEPGCETGVLFGIWRRKRKIMPIIFQNLKGPIAFPYNVEGDVIKCSARWDTIAFGSHKDITYTPNDFQSSINNIPMIVLHDPGNRYIKLKDNEIRRVTI